MLQNSSSLTVRRVSKSCTESYPNVQASQLSKNSYRKYNKKNQQFSLRSTTLTINQNQSEFQKLVIPQPVLNSIQKKLYLFTANSNISSEKRRKTKYFEQYAKLIMAERESDKREFHKSLDHHTLGKRKIKTPNKPFSTDGSGRFKQIEDTLKALRENGYTSQEKIDGLLIRQTLMSERSIQSKPKSVEFRRKMFHQKSQKKLEIKKKMSLKFEAGNDFTPWATNIDFLDADLQLGKAILKKRNVKKSAKKFVRHIIGHK